MITKDRLIHLKQLEVESIYILKKVVSEFDNLVIMYSVEKDSSSMLHLIMKGIK